MKNKRTIFKSKRGFSLLEVLIALFVLSVGVTGVLTLITISISNTSDARNAIVASQLAQEGIELVRYRRDDNIISDSALANVFAGLDANVCTVDAVNGLVCPGVAFDLNYDNNGTAVYSFMHSSNGEDTKFSRKIVIEMPSASERKIRSLVYWGSVDPADDGTDCLNINRCTFAETILTDWGGEN